MPNEFLANLPIKKVPNVIPQNPSGRDHFNYATQHFTCGALEERYEKTRLCVAFIMLPVFGSKYL